MPARKLLPAVPAATLDLVRACEDERGVDVSGMPREERRTLQSLYCDSADYNQQFEQMGVSPEEVMKKIMERPDLAAKFQNPKVQQAMMDITQNPQNISKYYADTDVMSLMTEMSQLFPNLAGGGGPPPV